jgi:hypothetical protein
MRSLRRPLEVAAAVLCLSTLARPQRTPSQFTFSPREHPFTFTRAEQPSKFSKEAFIFNRFVTRVTYESNGVGTRENLAAVRVQSDAGVQELAVLVFAYNQANETVEIAYVRVRKPDGSLVATPPQDFQDMARPVTRSAPMYSDLHEKHVPVKSLSVGDVLEYAVRYRTVKSEVPGQFWFEYSFTTNNIVIEEELEINLPIDKYVKVASPDLKPLVTESGLRRTYIWKTANLQKRKETEIRARGGEQAQPSVQITTFGSWGEVARWYGALQEQQVILTPEIRAKATELTNSYGTGDAKIRALYNFVSTHIHYISLSFGIGRYQPHTAEEVLDNGYGDCKDKHTLLAALIKSIGYSAWPVLINSSRKIDPDVPSPGQFDHVITVVPRSGAMEWLDTTPEVAPFALLAPSLRDKQALVIPTDGMISPSLMRTPSNSSLPSWHYLTISGKLNSNDRLVAHVQHSVSGDMEIPYRFAFRRHPQAEWDDLVQRRSWPGGTVHSVTASSPDDLDTPFEFAYEYSKNDYALSNGHVPLPFPPFEIESAVSDEEKPTDSVYIGPIGEIVYKASIDLPTGYASAALPKRVDSATDFADYHARYSLNGGVLMAERRLRIKKTELPVSEWDQFLKFRKVLRDDANGIENRGGANALLSVSVGVLFVSGLITVVTVWKKSGYKFTTRPSTDVLPDPHLTGIGGWLALFIIRLWLGVVMNLLGLEKHVNRLGVVVSIGFAVLAAVAAVLMMLKSHYGVKVANVYVLLEASVYLLLTWNAAEANNLPVFERMTWYFVVSILWWVYLVRSKRIRNTYFVAEWTEPPWMPQPPSEPAPPSSSNQQRTPETSRLA